MSKTFEQEIDEEVEAYFALNGETGAWGESMRDAIGVDVICDALEEGHGIEVTDDIRKIVEQKLKV